jgi:hypothetical protein
VVAEVHVIIACRVRHERTMSAQLMWVSLFDAAVGNSFECNSRVKYAKYGAHNYSGPDGFLSLGSSSESE